MLATMHSGIADYTADPGLVAKIIADPTAVHSADEVIGVGLVAPRVFAPDAQFAYSNTNYAILGKVLEQVSGQTFATLLREGSWTPWGWPPRGGRRNPHPCRTPSPAATR